MIDKSLIAEFARRDRARVRALKREHWARLSRESEGRETVSAGSALFMQARAVQPDFPSEASRLADFEHHLRLKELLDRAAPRFSRR